MRKFGKAEWIGVGVALVAAAILFFGGQIWALFTGSTQTVVNDQSLQSANEANQPTDTKTMQNISTVKGLEIYDEQVGTGAEAKAGQTVTAHYVGFLTNGTKFDSSLDRGQPFSFQLGGGQVIRGWDIGIQGMKVGGIRRLVISPELGYGANPVGSIPANSTLVFEVQLVDVK